MPDDMARALGAGSSTTVKIGGKDCTVRPLNIRELTEAERDCLQRYRRSYLETWQQNLDLLPEGSEMLRTKIEEAARWDVDDLPPKWAYDPRQIELTAGLKKWVKGEMNLEGKADNDRLQRLVTTALDQGLLSEKKYMELAGKEPKKAKVPYVNWWITGSFDGMITFVWLCFRPNGVTREEVIDALGDNPSLLADTSRQIEELSSPASGNG